MSARRISSERGLSLDNGLCPGRGLSMGRGLKIVSEYDQEIPQSQTADKPVAPRGRAVQLSRDTRKTNSAKQSALSSPSR